MMIPSGVARLDLAEMPIALRLDDGRRVKASTIVVATGARYRRLDVPNLRDFEGRGVWYWASPINARLCRDEEIVLVGGGNSAGRSAVFLRSLAKKIWMLVRGPSLAESMSQYLTDRIRAIDNIEVLTHTEIVALYGRREKQLPARALAQQSDWRRKPRNRSAMSFVSSVRSRQRAGSETAELPWTARTSF